MNQQSFFCPQCHQMKLFQQMTMNHTPHILASVFLCGLWLPVWAIIAANDNQSWRCSFCGYSDQPKYLVNPQLRAQEKAVRVRNWELKEQKRVDRGPVTLQERLAYFVSDNKVILIAVGIIAGSVTLIVVTLLSQNAK